MILVVDTYNVLHVVGVLPPEMAGIDVAGLARLIETSRYASGRVELICDGTPPADKSKRPRPRGQIRIRYAGAAGRSHDADALIAALIAKSTSPRRLTVVSSDQWIIRQAKRRRCRTMSSEQFLSHIAADAAQSAPAETQAKRPRDPISSRDVANWLQFFQMTPEEMRSLTKLAPPSAPPHPESTPDAGASGTSPVTPPVQRDHGPLTADVIEEAEGIWAEHNDDEV
jgi:hypothetical protein